MVVDQNVISEDCRKDLLECDPAWIEAGRLGSLALERRIGVWFWEWRDEIEGSEPRARND